MQKAIGTPQYRLIITNPTFADTTALLTVGDYGLVTIVANGANSVHQINDNTAWTGDKSTGALGGLTIGASRYGGASFSNDKIRAIIVRKYADDAATRDVIKNYLRRKYAIYD